MSKLRDDLIQQQDLYGAPPVSDEPIQVTGISGGTQALYGVPSPRISPIMQQELYGPPSVNVDSNTMVKNVAGGTGIILTIVLFIIGLVAMFNKKVSKTAKIIIGLSLFFIISIIIVLTIIIFAVL